MRAIASCAAARKRSGRRTALASHPHVASIHDLDVWEISSGFTALSGHVLVHPGDDCHGIRREFEQLLDHDFGIGHTTLQVDHEPSRLLRVGDPAAQHEH